MIIFLLILECLVIAIAANIISREMTDARKRTFKNFLSGAFANVLAGGLLLVCFIDLVGSAHLSIALWSGIAAWIIGNISGYAWVKLVHRMFAGLNRMS